MHRLMIGSFFVFVMATTGFAQENYSGQGYVFFAPGVSAPGGTATAHLGGGGEALFHAVGVGAEIGYVTPMRSFGDGVGILSPNASYHFLRNQKVSPFVTGGYSLFFRDGHLNGFNFGGGANYWLFERTALRFEVRDNVIREYSSSHLVGFRVGLTFR